MWRAVVLAALAGCSFRLHAVGSGDGSGLTGDAPAVCAAWHPHAFDPCSLGTPMPAPMLPLGGSPYTYDTTTEGGDLRDRSGALILHSPLVLAQTGGPDAALLSVDSLEVAASVVIDVIGTKPLVVASWSTITIAGDVDAGSHTTETDATKHLQSSTQIGAGAQTSCEGGAGAGSDGAPTGGSGGGGGGGFASAGGAGAVGDTGCTSGYQCPRPGGPAGGAAASPPAFAIGGCPGAASGQAGGGAQLPNTATTVSAGGAGGGAVQLAARMAIAITGTLRAGGAAGAGAPQGTACGGGGGGTGGYLGVDAPTITISGTVAANGGGGGGSAPFAGFGAPGQDGQPGATAASGGAAYPSTCGLPGGAGSTSNAAGTTATGNDACGGGGGGGGAGFVLSWGTLDATGSTVSPPVLPQ